MIRPTRLWSKGALALSIALYLLCLTQVGLCIEGTCDAWTPAGMLIFGVLELLHRSSWGAGVSWLANPLLFLSWGLALLAAHRWALIIGSCALTMALLIFFTRKVVASDSGLAQTVTGFPAGYWLWISSFAFAVLSAALGKVSVRDSQRATSAKVPA